MKPVDPRLLRYAGAARGFLAASALIGVAQTAVTIGFAWLLTDAVTGALAGRDVTASLLALLAVALLRGLLIAASDAAGVRAAARTGMQLREALMWSRRSTVFTSSTLRDPVAKSVRGGEHCFNHS